MLDNILASDMPPWRHVTVAKILSSIMLSWLSPYAQGIIGDHQCGFRCKRSNTDHDQMLQSVWKTSQRRSVTFWSQVFFVDLGLKWDLGCVVL